ncbi:glutathione S-transferase [Mycena filopes]|nr:glutathione S-transferase [Mycena filopes]
MTTIPTLLLHDHPLSPYASKVRLALRLKGLPFKKKVPAGLGSGHAVPTLSSANPRLEVPALEITPSPPSTAAQLKLFDSPIILQYLEEFFPAPTHRALLPSDPAARAHARMIEAMCDTHYEAINWGVGEVRFYGRAKGEQAKGLLDAAAAQTAQILGWLEAQLGHKEWFIGDGREMGYADVVVVPYLWRSVFNGMGPAEGSRLKQWFERVMEVPEVKETMAEAEAFAVKSLGSEGLFGKGKGLRREYRDHRLEWMIKSGGIGVVTEGLRDDTIRFSWPETKL